MPETNAVPIQCPNCGTQYQTPIRTIIDVGQQPQLRQAFLAGQVNLAVCPKCRAGGLIEMPLVYHDPAAEFLAVYFPQQLNIPEMEKQKMIGEMTQGLMRSLPAEQRKGYFLNPRQFMNRQKLMDAILGTMGISQEDLDRQRKKVKLVEQLAVMADDPKGLAMMIKGQDAQLDYEFFAILADTLNRAQALGDEKALKQLTMLREKLMEVTSFGKKAAKQQAAVESLKAVKTPEEFLEQVVAADPEVVDAFALAARPLMDYAFFQNLTGRIEAARGPERDRLTRLRERLVELTQKMDEAAKATYDEANGLLQELVSSENPRTAVREHAAELDDTFMAVLSSNLQEAQRRGRKAAFERMAMIYDEIMAMVEEGLPPEVQLINELLRAPFPEGVRDLLKEHQAELTPEFLEMMDRLAEEMGERETRTPAEAQELAETAKRLRDIKAQAMLLV
jgi:hypothetical protein